MSILLGKHMGWGWYGRNDSEELNKFFDTARDNSNSQEEHDAFELWREGETPGDWDYTNEYDDGFMILRRVNVRT